MLKHEDVIGVPQRSRFEEFHLSFEAAEGVDDLVGLDEHLENDLVETVSKV